MTESLLTYLYGFGWLIAVILLVMQSFAQSKHIKQMLKSIDAIVRLSISEDIQKLNRRIEILERCFPELMKQKHEKNNV